jgi:hypothetical protein
MIISTITNIAYYFVNLIISIFPIGGGFPEEVHNASQAIGGYLNILSPLVPLATLSTVVGLVFALELSLLGFRTFKWLFSYIPFIGGR